MLDEDPDLARTGAVPAQGGAAADEPARAGTHQPVASDADGLVQAVQDATWPPVHQPLDER
jgi:hypothetical protein